MRKRRAAPSFLVHLAACKPLGFGSVQAAAGQLGAAGLIPLGGPDANAAGLGALSGRPGEFVQSAPGNRDCALQRWSLLLTLAAPIGPAFFRPSVLLSQESVS